MRLLVCWWWCAGRGDMGDVGVLVQMFDASYLVQQQQQS
jgi:hypothetical protein